MAATSILWEVLFRKHLIFWKTWVDFPSESFSGPHGAWGTGSFQDNDITLALYYCNIPVNVDSMLMCERNLEPCFKVKSGLYWMKDICVWEKIFSGKATSAVGNACVYSRSFVWPVREVVWRENYPKPLWNSWVTREIVALESSL